MVRNFLLTALLMLLKRLTKISEIVKELKGCGFVQRFKAAGYCRLSHDDIVSQNRNGISDSIANQKLLIESYVAKNSNEFELADTYVDDGISGMTYDRAAFKQMMSDIKDKKINAVIVKDLSRIGREQIETLNLIKKEFILKDIRFIALTDDYDSFDSSKSDGFSTSVKLLLNDYYCADISKKVRSSQKVKRERGDFIGSHAPYGYTKDPNNKNRLRVDDEAAEIVKRIFNMYISGMGKQAIARKLNEEKTLNPTEYKRCILKSNYTNSNKLSNNSYWTYSTINYILNNEVYIGSVVQHKSEVKAYNIHKKVSVPKDNWCVVKNVHPAIISEDDFEIVQKMLLTKRRKINFDENNLKYTGIFFCKDCGRRMNKFLSKPKKDGSRYNSFKCSSYSMLGKDICSIHSIREDELDKIVLEEIRKNIKLALNFEACEYIRKKTFKNLKGNFEDKIKNANDNLQRCFTKKSSMLKYLAENVISADDFKQFDLENSKEIEELRQIIFELEEKSQNKNKHIQEYRNWVDNLLKYKDINEVNREIIVNLIDSIYISEDKKGENKEIEINFKFKNPLEV